MGTIDSELRAAQRTCCPLCGEAEACAAWCLNVTEEGR